MPNTSSSVPYLLSSSMNSIRSRRPSACLSGSQGSGILQQLGSGMVRQLSSQQVNGRAFPSTNVRQCPSLMLTHTVVFCPYPYVFSLPYVIHCKALLYDIDILNVRRYWVLFVG